uniref:Uncharacterized protein n=1 Tax=Rhizophora mucronata TaxID=61149 RepID=A0A2P2QJC6_RHIMU
MPSVFLCHFIEKVLQVLHCWLKNELWYCEQSLCYSKRASKSTLLFNKANMLL